MYCYKNRYIHMLGWIFSYVEVKLQILLCDLHRIFCACLCYLNIDTTTPTFRNGDVRLVNTVSNSNTSGRLEVYYRGQWGTVCDDNFNNNAAMVVCRQLGFTPFGAIAVSIARFGRGVGPIWLDNVRCSGLEPNIDSCRHNAWGSHDCSHSEDTAVICLCKLIHALVLLINGNS